MQAGQDKDRIRVFQAPVLYVAVLYGIILLWTVGTVPLIVQKFQDGWLKGDWLYAAMIAFFYGYTWYWALGLFTSISLDAGGQVVLKGVRRRLAVPAGQIRAIEGSRFSGGFGFVKFKLSRESGYLFCYQRDEALDEILKGIGRANPLLRAVRI